MAALLPLVLAVPGTLEARAEAPPRVAAPKAAPPAKAPPGVPAPRANPKTPMLVSAGEHQWTVDPQRPGVTRAVLWGNPKLGPYGALDRWGGGTEVPLHTHSHTMKAVVASGTLIVTLEGQSPKELGEGSYMHLPSASRHAVMCKEGSDCVVFVEQPGIAGLKIVPAEPAAPPDSPNDAQMGEKPADSP